MRSYAIQIVCDKSVVLKTRKKMFVIDKGEYIYVGSCGRNCESRVRRHYSRKNRFFWHIDYLTEKCKVVSHVFFDIEEKELAKILSKKLEYVPGFGSTDDSGSPSHLFKGSIQVIGKML